MADRTYKNPHVLEAMTTNQQWPISVTYKDDGTAVVECGHWGAEGWIRFTETFRASELHEAKVAKMYKAQQAAR